MGVQIESDGVTVWVNSTITGECIARFGRMGIDIHRPIGEQVEGKGQCLHCTHGQTTAAHWREFQQKMLELYAVEVGDEHMPTRFKEKACA